MLDRRRPWNGQHHGRSTEKPRQRYLRWTCTVCFGDSVKHFAGNLSSSQWIPRNKGNPVALTIIHDVVPFAVRKAVAVLNRNDRDNFARSLDMLLGDVGQRDQVNLAFVSQLSQSFHRRLKRDGGIRNMQLIDL